VLRKVVQVVKRLKATGVLVVLLKGLIQLSCGDFGHVVHTEAQTFDLALSFYFLGRTVNEVVLENCLSITKAQTEVH
jgi:hypothetical protein